MNREERSGTHDLGLAQVLVAHRRRLHLKLKPVPEGAGSEWARELGGSQQRPRRGRGPGGRAGRCRLQAGAAPSPPAAVGPRGGRSIGDILVENALRETLVTV